MLTPDAQPPERLSTLPSWLLNQSALVATRLVGTELGRLGAHRYDYAVLASLDELGPASQAELGRRSGLDRSDVVAVLDRLAESGHIERAPDTRDRRRNVVTITRSGRAQLRTLDRALSEAQDLLLSPLSNGERAALVDLLGRVVEHHSPS